MTRQAGLTNSARETNASAAADAIAKLRLRCWPEVQDLVMVRLIDRERAGPLARAVPCCRSADRKGRGRPSRTTGADNLCFDVGVAVADGAVRPTAEHVASWGRDPATIWGRALANTEQHLAADIDAASVGNLSFHSLSGGLFTTGVLAVDPSTLDRLGVPPPTQAHSTDLRTDPATNMGTRRRICALAPTAVVVLDPLAGADHGPDIDDALGQSFAVRLAALFPDRLRPNLFRHVPAGTAEIAVQGSFPWVRILE